MPQGHRSDEVRAVEAHRRRAVGDRRADVAEAFAQCGEGERDVPFRIDIAAETEAGDGHGRAPWGRP